MVIALGHGTQNYTCTSDYAAIPVPIGAEAELLDTSAVLAPFMAVEAVEILNQITPYLLKYDIVEVHHLSPPVLGQHYFANTGPAPADGTPTFDLGLRGFLSSQKIEAIRAPSDAGVDWLLLTAKEPSKGLREVYRIETSGGQAPKSCTDQPAFIEIPYAAQYWFYG
jgi:hypothetical protein